MASPQMRRAMRKKNLRISIAIKRLDASKASPSFAVKSLMRWNSCNARVKLLTQWNSPQASLGMPLIIERKAYILISLRCELEWWNRALNFSHPEQRRRIYLDVSTSLNVTILKRKASPSFAVKSLKRWNPHLVWVKSLRGEIRRGRAWGCLLL